MLHRYLNVGAYAALLLTLLCTGVRAQNVILNQGFEGDVADDFSFTPNPTAFTDSDDVWNVVSTIGGINPNSGLMFWGGQDLASPMGTMTGEKGILSFDAGTICQLTSAKFTFAYHAIGFDSGDDLGYTLYLDGFPEPDVILVDGGTGGVSSSGWETANVSIPGTATTARLEIFVIQNGAADYFGIDDVQLTATGMGGSCTPVCGVNVNPGMVLITCDAFTTGPDAVSAVIPYSGAETGVTVSVTGGGVVGGDDPALVADGEINITNLLEGQSYMVTISGGDCVGAEEIMITLDGTVTVCEPGALLINEFLADPPSGATYGEFVELVNISDMPLDISNYTVEDGANNQQTFGSGITLLPGEGIVLYDAVTDGTPPANGCYVEEVPFLALNNDGDDIIVRDATGQIVTQYTYGPEGGNNQSLALTPDRDPAGMYQLHIDELGNTEFASPCFENENNGVGLPVEMLDFVAHAAGKEVELRWSTANETANERFLIERRAVDHEWQVIGAVFAGDSAENSYEFTDENPLNGANYYRLRQLDFDGNFSLYGPVMAEFAAEEFLLFPNPATTEIRFGGTFAGTERITLHDATGRLLREVAVGADGAGIADLRQGVYLLRIVNDKGMETIRFVKR